MHYYSHIEQSNNANINLSSTSKSPKDVHNKSKTPTTTTLPQKNNSPQLIKAHHDNHSGEPEYANSANVTPNPNMQIMDTTIVNKETQKLTQNALHDNSIDKQIQESQDRFRQVFQARNRQVPNQIIVTKGQPGSKDAIIVAYVDIAASDSKSHNQQSTENNLYLNIYDNSDESHQNREHKIKIKNNIQLPINSNIENNTINKTNNKKCNKIYGDVTINKVEKNKNIKKNIQSNPSSIITQLPKDFSKNQHNAEILTMTDDELLKCSPAKFCHVILGNTDIDQHADYWIKLMFHFPNAPVLLMRLRRTAQLRFCYYPICYYLGLPYEVVAEACQLGWRGRKIHADMSPDDLEMQNDEAIYVHLQPTVMASQMKYVKLK